MAQARSIRNLVHRHGIANRFPELDPRLPRFRKPWMSEDYRMSIFDRWRLPSPFYVQEQSEGVPDKRLNRSL